MWISWSDIGTAWDSSGTPGDTDKDTGTGMGIWGHGGILCRGDMGGGHGDILGGVEVTKEHPKRSQGEKGTLWGDRGTHQEDPRQQMDTLKGPRRT